MRALARLIPRFLGSPVNTALALGLLVFLVVLPLTGVQVPVAAELVGGNYTNVVGYLAASIAAGASVAGAGAAAANLREGRRHRDEVTAAVHAHRSTLDELRELLTASNPAPGEKDPS